MSKLVSRKFSTPDLDNDYSCAQQVGAGWWYKNDNNCAASNLNGFYKDEQLVVEKPWEGFDYTLKISELKVKPQDP